MLRQVLTRTFLRSKREQARRRGHHGPVSLGLPVVPRQNARPQASDQERGDEKRPRMQGLICQIQPNIYAGVRSRVTIEGPGFRQASRQ